MGIAAVLVGMLALNAGPAMADELDGVFTNDDFSSDEFVSVDEGTTTLDELCSPGLSDGIFIPGCIFSDSIEEDINFDDEEVVFFLEEDIDFDFDDFEDEDEDIFDDDHDNHDNEREVLRGIDRD
jgi:hypothetical protein